MAEEINEEEFQKLLNQAVEEDISRKNTHESFMQETQEQYIEDSATQDLQEEFARSAREYQEETDIWDETWSQLYDVGLATVGGFRDAAQSTFDFINATLSPITDTITEGVSEGVRSLGAEGLAKTIEESGKKPSDKLPEVPEPKTFIGGLVRPMAQFLLPFTQFNKAIKAGGVLKGAASALVSGAITDFIAFDEHEGLLLDALADTDLVKNSPEQVKEILGILKKSPEEPFLEGRLKNAVEGLALGVATDAVFKGIKFIWKGRYTKAKVSDARERRGKRSKDIEGLRQSLEKLKEDALSPTIKDGGVEVKSVVGGSEVKAGDGKKNIGKGLLERAKLPEGLTRKSKDTIDIETQKRFAREVNLTTRELENDVVLEKLKKSGIQERLNKVTLLQNEAFAKFKLNLVDIAEQIELEDPKAVDFLNDEFEKYMRIHYSAKDQHQISARALGLRSKEESVKVGNAVENFMSNTLNEKEKIQSIKDMVDIVASGGDIGVYIDNLGKAALRKGPRRENIWDLLRSFRYNAMLSSPVTLATDTLSNPVWNSYLIAERAVSAGVGAIRKAVIKEGTSAGLDEEVLRKMSGGFFQKAEDSVVFKEAMVMADSMIESIKSGIEYIGKAGAGSTKRAVRFRSMMDEKLNPVVDVIREVRKKRVDTQTRFDYKVTANAIPFDEVNTDFDRFVNFVSSVGSVPTRYMKAKDDIAKMVFYRAEVSALAHRKATNEGLVGQAYSRRVNELMDVPLDDRKLGQMTAKEIRKKGIVEMLSKKKFRLLQEQASVARQSIAASREATFTQDPIQLIKSLDDVIKEGGSMGAILDLIIPFRKTPSNILGEIGKRSPLAPFAASFRADISAGGARADMALGRMAFGSAVMSLGGYFASKGIITGELSVDKRERQALLAAGARPNSVLVGDTYYNLSRIAPIGIMLTIPANIVNLQKALDDRSVADLDVSVDDYYKAGVLAIANSTLDSSFMQGFSQALEAIAGDDPDKLERYMGFIAGSYVPNAATFVANQIDPILKEADGFYEAIINKVGLVDRIRRNFLGEPIKRDPQFTSALMPFAWSTVTTDPLLQELVRSGAKLPMPNGRIEGVELNKDQYERMMEIISDLGVREGLNKVIKNRVYPQLKDAESTGVPGAESVTKSGLLKMVYTEYKNAAAKKLVSEDVDLQLKIKARRLEETTGIRLTPSSKSFIKANGITFNPN